MGAVILRAKVEFKPKSVYFPKQLPTDELEWPALRQRPVEPTKQPIGLYIIPGFLMLGAVFLQVLFGAYSNQNPWAYLVSGLSAFSSVAMAGYYWWDYRKRQQVYRQQLHQRIEEFQHSLRQLEYKAQQLAQQQRRILEDRYPSTNLLLQIVLDPKTRDKRLWARSGEDEDFLNLRLGTGEDAPSFTFQKPPTFPPEDQELNQMVQNLYQQWQRIPDLPIIVPIAQVGSMVVLGRGEVLEGLLYRMVLDLAVHQSPRRLRIGVIGHNLQKASRRWGWMRWLPHTRVLEAPEPSFLAFTPEEGYQLIDYVAKRLKSENRKTPSASFSESIVLFLDDAGLVRRSQTVQHLIEQGPQVGVYLVLVGEPVTRGVRAVVRVSREGKLSYKAELPSHTGGDDSRVVIHRRGRAETLNASQAEEAARAMLQLEPPEPPSLLAQIPDTVPLTDLLARVYQGIHRELIFPQNEPSGTMAVKAPPSSQEVLNTDAVITLWQQFLPLFSPGVEQNATPLFRYLLRFPLGLTLKQGRLEPVMLNLLPEGSKWDGKAAYHSILIGPTGSGKSEFLKTLIWCGAYLYPPALFNVFLLDFKAGAAAEDLKVRSPDGLETYLPHLVGVVTNPGQSDATLSARAISRRGIHAIRLEIARRETLISRRGQAKDIWEYNEKVLAARRGETNSVDANLPLLPHLLIILDEFSKAVEDFPELGDILDDLVRRGRSLGIYLLLGNQLVTAPVTRLLPNVGWRIGLKLRGEMLREVIPGNWPDLDRVGRGYLRCESDGQVQPFQSAYGGVALREEAQDEHWDIYEIEPTGRSSKPLFRYKRRNERENDREDEKKTDLTQGRYLTRLLLKVVQEHPEFHPHPRKVYLEPLPPGLDMEPLLREAGPLAFEGGQWREPVYQVETSLSTPIGLMDNLEEVRYDPVHVTFHQGVGHLWVLGTPTSGKDLVVTTLLLALAHRYTPEQVWFYLVESGTDLKALERLPHAGAHISLSHRERFARFLDFLKHEYETRKAYPERRVPRLVVVLHNFHRRVWGEIRDEVLFLVEQLLKNGAALGIHLILTSASVTALRDEDASALVPRLVLDMGKNEHFWDAGVSRKSFFELTRKVPGRGYWLERLGQKGREAQIARFSRAKDVMAQMDTAWMGSRPPSLRPLPRCITWQDWKRAWAMHNPKTPWYNLGLPAGYNFDHQAMVAPLGRSDPLWMVVAPAGRGKTYLLLLWAQAARERPEPWTVWYLGAQPPPQADVFQASDIHLFTGEDLQEGWQRLAQALQEDQTPPSHLLLLDDGEQTLALCPEQAAATIVEALQKGHLFGLWAFRTPNLSRISASLTFDHPFKDLLLRLPEERRGFVLSQEPDFLGLYNFSMRTFQDYPAQWEALKNPARGRGLWVYRDTWKVVQIPSWTLCEEEADEFN